MRLGDKAAKKVVDSYINYLSVGVTNVVNAIRPEAVILGGGVCAEGDALIVPLTKKVEKSVLCVGQAARRAFVRRGRK